MTKRVKINHHKKFIHPEQKEHEVLICYTDDKGFKKMAWKTKRKGIKVIDYYNIMNLDENHKLFPVFIERAEYEEYRFGKTKEDQAERKTEIRKKISTFGSKRC